MTEQDAKAAATQARSAHHVPPTAEILWAEKRYIELPEGSREAPGRVRDVLVWVVRFQDGIRWTDLAVADSNGQVVRVERSR